MSIWGSILIENRNDKGDIINDDDVQEFEGLNFKIKLETLECSLHNSRLIFLNMENEEIETLDNIIITNISSSYNEFQMFPLPSAKYYLIEHLQKYQVTYNYELIYQLNSEKKIIIYNFCGE